MLNSKPRGDFDPLSAIFEAGIWFEEFIGLNELDSKSASSRELEVAFNNLSVFEWSTGAKSQTTTGSVLTDIRPYLIRLIGGNKNERRIDILQDFEGVAANRKMLLMLDPPGFNCSILLKALSGNYFDLSPDSCISFRGTIPTKKRDSQNIVICLTR